MLIDLLKLLLT